MSTTTRPPTHTTDAPHPAAGRLHDLVRTTVQTLHTVTATLDALADNDTGSPLTRYRLSQLGVQAWIAGQRGQQLLATLGVNDRFDSPLSPAHLTATGTTTARAATTAGVAGVLDDLLGAVNREHLSLVTVVATDDPHPALLFLHDVGAVCQELATHVR